MGVHEGFGPLDPADVAAASEGAIEPDGVREVEETEAGSGIDDERIVVLEDRGDAGTETGEGEPGLPEEGPGTGSARPLVGPGRIPVRRDSAGRTPVIRPAGGAAPRRAGRPPAGRGGVRGPFFLAGDKWQVAGGSGCV